MVQFRLKSLAKPRKFSHFDENTKAFSQKYVHNFTKLIKGTGKSFNKRLKLNFRHKHLTITKKLFINYGDLFIRERGRRNTSGTFKKFSEIRKIIPVAIVENIKFERERPKYEKRFVFEKTKKRNARDNLRNLGKQDLGMVKRKLEKKNVRFINGVGIPLSEPTVRKKFAEKSKTKFNLKKVSWLLPPEFTKEKKVVMKKPMFKFKNVAEESADRKARRNAIRNIKNAIKGEKKNCRNWNREIR